MKKRIFKQYRTKKHGGQRYWLGKTIKKNYGSSTLSRMIDRQGNIPSKRKVNKEAQLIIRSQDIPLFREITPVVLDIQSGVIPMDKYRESVNRSAQLRKMAKNKLR